MMEKMESPRRSASPEFEFWMVGNSHPDLEPSGILTADELFVDGIVLPLRLLSLPPDPNPEEPKPPPSCQEASICYSNPAPLTSSKRWRDIFKVGGDRKKESAEEKEKEKKKERKASNGTAELNINIWPFSRSRSAGTAAGGRPKAAAAAAAAAMMRKSRSAPCSRSNSRGESSGGRRWAASPGRPGVHVGRASPVWQPRRAGKGGRARGGKTGLGLNVNSCIGYRRQVRCRGEDCDGGGVQGAANNNANGSLFKFRALFSKKVY